MTSLRWIAVVPCAVLAWYAALAAGLVLLSAVSDICPHEDMISGLCVAWWYEYAEWAVVKSSVAASAFVVVISAAATAPSCRLQVAWVAYVTGSVVATYFVTQMSVVTEFIVALIAGLAGVIVAAKYFRSTTCPTRHSKPTRILPRKSRHPDLTKTEVSDAQSRTEKNPAVQ
jgi:hypothetical protein